MQWFYQQIVNFSPGRFCPDHSTYVGLIPEGISKILKYYQNYKQLSGYGLF